MVRHALIHAELAPQLVSWRRHLHAHPELSGQEVETAAWIAGQLREFGYVPRERVGGTCGVTAELVTPGVPFIALRADMDALPIQEENALPYSSTRPGVMHACGHDAHVAMLLGAAKVLAARRGELRRSVRFIFQPAEEAYPGGAAPLIDAGVLAGVERILGLHIWSETPTGTVGTRVGPFMAGVTDFSITVSGKGGHAAMPQQCVDPIVVAAEIVLASQTAVSRGLAMTDAGVLSITRIEAGRATNVIPPQATLSGTIRTLSEATRATLVGRLRQVAEGVGAAHGAGVALEVQPGYPPLVNDSETVTQALAAAARVGITGEHVLNLPPQGGGEDFAYYAQHVPAAFLFLGARDEGAGSWYPHHHPRFQVDEAALPLGTSLLVQFALAAGAAH